MNKTNTNLTGYRGVTFDKKTGRYIAKIGYKKEMITLGRFDTAEEAARAYDKASLYYYGKKGYLNFREYIQPINEIPNASLVLLSNGEHGVVDSCHIEEVNKYLWHAQTMCKEANTWYINRNVKKGDKWGSESLHAFINRLNGLSGHTDHWNRSGWDCRTINLRPCTQSQNNANQAQIPGNTSKYKGVSFVASRNKWVAQLRFNGRYVKVGRFKNEIDAAKAYDKKAFECWGDFAYLNFPEDYPQQKKPPFIFKTIENGYTVFRTK